MWKIVLILIFIIITAFKSIAQDTLPEVSKLSELSLEDLMNIKVVTASRFEQKISEAPSTMIVITSQQINERGYEELDEALRDIPGLDLQHTSGTFSVLKTFRGMYGDENARIIFMIDGIVENNILGGFEMGGPAYSLHNVERIEIIFGPASALYGANAFGGVINMITKKGKDISGFHFQRGLGSFNTSFEKLMYGVKKSNFDISFSASRLNSDGPRYTNRGINYSNSYVDNAWSFYGNIGYAIKNCRTTLGFRAFETPGGVGAQVTVPAKLLGLPSQGNGNKGDAGVLQSDIRGEKPSLWNPYTRTVFLQNEVTPDSKFTLFTRLKYRETGLSDDSYNYVVFAGNRPVSRLIYGHYSNIIEGEANTNYTFSEHHKFSAGIQYSQANLERGYRETNPDTGTDTIDNIPFTNIHASFKPRENTIRNNFGTYLQYMLTSNLLRNTNFTIGTRYDNNSDYGTTVNPRLAIINEPVETITIKLFAGTSFRAPTNFERFGLANIRLANMDLQPEKIRTYEANIIINLSKFYLIQANGFRNELTDIVVNVISKNAGLPQNQNVGSAVINGAETKLDILFSKNYTGFINFTFQKGKQNDGITEYTIPNIANYKGSAGITAHIAEIFSISLIENYVGKRSVPETNPLGKVGEYFITNFVISVHNLFDNRVSASLNIRNLTNQNYFDPGIRAADGNLYSTVLDQPGINGLFKISITIN